MNILYMRTQTLCHRIEKKINQKFAWLASINISRSTDCHSVWLRPLSCGAIFIWYWTKLVSLNRNGLLFKKVTFKILNEYTIEFNNHDVDIFINGKWQKYAGNIGWLFKITRLLELRFWPTRNQSQPSQGNSLTWALLLVLF